MNDHSNIPNERAVMGSNQGPSFNPEVTAEFEEKIRDFADAAAEWKEQGEITDNDTAEKANDFLSGARKLFKSIEDRRREEKQPYLDAGREVDAAFNSLKSKIEKAVGLVKKPLEAFMKEQERLERERKAREAKEARRAQEEAARKAREAERRNDVIAQDEAETELKEAEKAETQARKKTTTKVGSATGGGRSAAMRTTRTAHLTNVNQAMLHYRTRPEMSDLLVRLANADIRAAKGEELSIPGFEIKTERKL